MACVQASIEALADVNRALASLASHHQALREEMHAHLQQHSRAGDGRAVPGGAGTQGYSRRIGRNGAWVSRTGATPARSTCCGPFRNCRARSSTASRCWSRTSASSPGRQHTGFQSALDRNTVDVQQRLWRDLEEIRGEYEKLIHTELKLIRQKAVAESAVAAAAARGRATRADRDRLVPFRRGLSRIGRANPRASESDTWRSFEGATRGPRSGLRARRISGSGARRRPDGARHRSERGMRRDLPFEGTDGGSRRAVRIPGWSAGSIARRGVLFAGGGALAAGASAGSG